MVKNVNVLLEEAENFHKNKEYLDARKTYLQVLKEDKTNREALIGLAGVHHDEGNTKESIRRYRMVNQIYPGDAHLLHDLGCALAERGILNEGLTYLFQAKDISPKDVGIMKSKSLVSLMAAVESLDELSYFCVPKEREKYQNMSQFIKKFVNGRNF